MNFSFTERTAKLRQSARSAFAVRGKQRAITTQPTPPTPTTTDFLRLDGIDGYVLQESTDKIKLDK
jgi:hypothetical protein